MDNFFFFGGPITENFGRNFLRVAMSDDKPFLLVQLTMKKMICNKYTYTYHVPVIPIAIKYFVFLVLKYGLNSHVPDAGGQGAIDLLCW